MLFEYVEEAAISTFLICSICTLPAIDPMVTPCVHLFCSVHICDWLAENDTCPICRTHCSKTSLKNEHFVGTMLNELKVYCVNKAAGCVKIMSRSDLDEHLSRFCGFTPCSNALRGCTWRGIEQLIAAHISNACQFGLIECPEGCRITTLERCQLAEHLESSCVVVIDRLQRECEEAAAKKGRNSQTRNSLGRIADI